MNDVTEYFNAVYDATFRELMRLCLLKAPISDAHDILQNTYAKFFRHISRKGTSSVRDPNAYLIKVLRHETARFHMVRAALNEVPLEAAENEPSCGASVEEISINSAEHERIISILNDEPDDVRRIFILYYGYGMRLGEIAKQMGSTEAAVKSRLVRSRKKIRTKLEREENHE